MLIISQQQIIIILIIAKVNLFFQCDYYSLSADIELAIFWVYNSFWSLVIGSKDIRILGNLFDLAITPSESAWFI